MKKRASDSIAKKAVPKTASAVMNAEVRALLEHLAADLADEYVRLMKEAANTDSMVAEEKEDYR